MIGKHTNTLVHLHGLIGTRISSTVTRYYHISIMQMLEQFIMQYYSGREKIVKEILIAEDLENRQIVEQYLTQKAGHSVKLLVPQRGNLVRLTELAKANATEFISNKVGRTRREVAALEELKSAGS